MRRSAHVLVSLLMALLSVVACSGPPEPPSGQTEHGPYDAAGTFSMHLWSDRGPLDPYHNSLMETYVYLAYDSLVNPTADGRFVSGLAERWQVTTRSATFELKSGVTCSDGTKLQASDVANAINYASDPAKESSQYGTNTPTVPLAATGDNATRTVRVALKKPFGFLLETIGQLPIVCPKGLQSPGILKSSSSGTGPFVLKQVVPGQSYTFTRRDGYTWGPGGASTAEPGTPATVVLKIIENETTAANLLMSGELSLAHANGPDRERLAARGLDKIEVPLSGAWLWFNQIGSRPTADPQVRRALALALDLDELVKVNAGRYGGAATGLISREPNICPGDTLTSLLPDHDLAAAEKLLDSAGWTKGADGVRRKDGKPLTVSIHYTRTQAQTEPTAQLLAQQWGKLGAQAQPDADVGAEFGHVLFETSDYDVYMVGFNYTLPSHMVTNLSGDIPPKGGNIAGIKNNEYVRLAGIAATMTPPAACTYWHQAEQALWRGNDILPIAKVNDMWFLQKAKADFIGLRWPVPTSIRVFQ
jgi:peptide/nickel transport system substrate-binding protein